MVVFSNILNCRGEYLGVYAAIGAGQIVLSLFASYFLAMGGVFGATLIHKRLLVNILRLPMSFFDTTPSGRILNRFSKDIYTIDETIPRCVDEFIFTLFVVIDTIVVISYATPLFMVVIIPLAVLYLLIQVRNVLHSVSNHLEFFFQRFYVATSRQLKRLESISRSPIYTHFQETLLGSFIL